MPVIEPKWVLARLAKVVEHHDQLTVFGPTDRRVFDGDSAALARAVLEALRTPCTRAELLAALERTFEGVGERPEVVDALLGHLRATGTIGEPGPAQRRVHPLAGARVLVAATGAVASAMTPVLVGQLQAAGADVRVALTPSARKFVSPRALEALTHRPVYDSLWHGTPGEPAPHIALASWADAVLVAPCTATTLARLARGDCSALVTAVAVATRAPVILAPSMNQAMLEAPAVARNLAQLRADGFHVLWPTWGVEVAEHPDARTPMVGPMLPPDALVAVVAALTPARAPTPRPDASFWDAVYGSGAALPWDTTEVDPDLAAALRQGRGRLLDLGCGLGTVAISAAQLGYEVTASDVSPVAIAQARHRAGAAPIAFVADDVLASKLEGPFDVIVDRAVLHTLPVATHDRYLRQVTRLLKPGARLLLKVHADPDASRRLGTTAFEPSTLTTLLQPDLQVESCLESTLAGARALWVIARRA